MIVRSCAALLAALGVAGCLAENPPEDSDTDPGTSTATDTGPIVPPESMLGCPPGEVCTIVLASQSFDDRVEIFAPDDAVNKYRGAIDFDLRMGVDADNLDEPVGLALTADFLHISAGHYPNAGEGTLVSIPRTMLGNYAAGTTVPVGDILLAGAFREPVVAAAFGVAEPIFVLDTPVEGRLLIGTFNNSIMSTEDAWTNPGLLHVVDVADPTQFGTATLTGCQGAAQIVMMEGSQAAVACDGNEVVAFLNLGDIGTGSPEAAAQAIVVEQVCPVYPPPPGYRVRYLAYAGADGVVVGYGPGLSTPDAAGRVYGIRRTNCTATPPLEIGPAMMSHPAQIVRVGDAFLVASGAAAETEDVKRGIFVVTPELTLCPDPLPNFAEHWAMNVDTGEDFEHPLQPFALALAPDGVHLAVGAAVNAAHADTEVEINVYGKVLWAELQNVEEPCAMTANVVDLTDGAGGHGPTSKPGMRTTYRKQTYAVSVTQVQG